MARSLALLILIALFSSSTADATVLFRCPLSHCSGVSSWFDHASASGSLLRYDGATSFSYDNHHGIDYARGFWTSIYSGAIGALYYRVANCPNGSYPSCGGYYGNQVRIEHADNSVTIYAHMQYGTPAWYSTLLCGSTVGNVGNSGRSTNSHLHFELWSDRYISQRLDFYGGTPNGYANRWLNYNSPSTTCQ